MLESVKAGEKWWESKRRQITNCVRVVAYSRERKSDEPIASVRKHCCHVYDIVKPRVARTIATNLCLRIALHLRGICVS
jgi:hypothetical protein